MENTGQQWDYPNAWPPSVHMIIDGLAASNSVACQNEARIQADKWTRINYVSFIQFGQMFEKMNVETGSAGSGGEYDVQTGFGWSNGVIFDLLNRYGTILDSPSSTLVDRFSFQYDADKEIWYVHLPYSKLKDY